jgi:hypothetical protein
MAHEAAMQARSRQLRDLIAQTAHDVVERQKRSLTERDNHRFLDGR